MPAARSRSKPVRSELVWLLVSLDTEYAETSPELPWPQWYTERIVERPAGRPN
jgi:hypothetical protein